MSNKRNNRRSPSLPLQFYLDLLDQIKSAKTIEPPLSAENIEEVVTKFNDKSGIFLDTVWSILVGWGDLKRFQNHYDCFKKAAVADFKFFVESMNSAYTVAQLPANHPDRKYTLKVVNGLQLFDLPNCGKHVRNIVKFFQLVTVDLPDNNTKDADTVNLVRVIIYIIIHTFRILHMENRPPDPLAAHEHDNTEHAHDHEHHHHHHDHSHDHDHQHVHGPDCNHTHVHEHQHQHQHHPHEHVHGPECNHDHEHHHHHHHEHTPPVTESPQNNSHPPDTNTTESAPKAENEKPPVINFKENECVQCGSQAANKCSGCLGVYYCSKECQKKNWPSHKQMCAILRNQKPQK